MTGRGEEDVAQMEAETLLPNDGQPSGDLALTKGWPCEASMAPELGAFSGIYAQGDRVVFDPTRIGKHFAHFPIHICFLLCHT